MAKVLIEDIIEPNIFADYVIQRTTEKSNLVQSGIVAVDPKIDALAKQGGRQINMPYFDDLVGNDQVLDDSVPLDTKKIASGQDIATLLMRGDAWAVNDLSAIVSGADPMGAIADRVANYWVRKEQDILLHILEGVFEDNLENDNGDLIHSVAIEDGDNAEAKNLIGVDAVLDAVAKLGDAYENLSAIAMHSIPFFRLNKLGLIEFEVVTVTDGTNTATNATQDERGAVGKEIKIPYYLGKRVIVDDGCPVSPGDTSGFKYTSYLFGAGAIARGDGVHPYPVETDRDSLAGDDVLIHRRCFILHPRGFAWQGLACDGASPTNAELMLPENWNRVYAQKACRIVKLVTNG